MKLVIGICLVCLLGMSACGGSTSVGSIEFEAGGNAVRMEGASLTDIHAGTTDCDTSHPGNDRTCVYRHWNAEAGAKICFSGTTTGTFGGEVGLLFDNYQHTSSYAVPEQVTINVTRYDDRLAGTFAAVVKRNQCSEDERTLTGNCGYETCVSITAGRFDVPFVGASTSASCTTVVGPGVGANGPTCP